MAVRTITNTVTLPGTTTPWALKNITIRLNVPVFGTAGAVEKIRALTVQTDTSGTWTAVLDVNADLDPAGTSYTVGEASGVLWTFVVPAGDPAVVMKLRDCLVDAPTNPTPIVAPDVAGIIDAMFATPAAATASPGASS
jgi:hypothetical protein